jgi:hypothetical protein
MSDILRADHKTRRIVVENMANHLLMVAAEMNMNVTIELTPVGRPCMGSHQPVVKVWPSLSEVRMDMAAAELQNKDEKFLEVQFCHDLEDGWYRVQVSDATWAEDYNFPRDIEAKARDLKLRIKWVGKDQSYNPWRDNSHVDRCADFDQLIFVPPKDDIVEPLPDGMLARFLEVK